MSQRHDNPAALAERVADLLHDTALLEHLVQCALESARSRVVYFARLATIARYGLVADHSTDNLLEIIRSIQELAEKYEQCARGDRESLAAASAYRKITRYADGVFPDNAARH
ncbi:hypothetical protein [Burkholderia ubonensis]|uniref:hypothetical protein n=1 Tax=Burkholderia ubonensis TaxID=101571 RepID=UPI000AA16125|nr:hypothetical protein [Burkholderia ubonensis]